jgi:hypothetical protein
MTFHTDLRPVVLPLVLLVGVFLGASALGAESTSASSGEGQQTGKVLSVRKVLQNPYFVSRYPIVHYFTVYFTLRISDQTYCAEYETPVLDEINDLFSAKGKDLEVVRKGKNLTVRTPGGRSLKARLTGERQC